MKAIRRSIKGEKEQQPLGPRHNSIPPKSALAIQPPKKVIKALYDYEADPSKPHELSFHKGDFFHVISREDDEDWYEAANPLIPTARGLVPVTYFEVIGKTEGRQSSGSARSIGSPQQVQHQDSGYNTAASSSHGRSSSTNIAATGPGGMRMSKVGSGGKPGAMVYGIVQYDFQAERPDELEAKAGEAIIVIAQSNPEWFVAKPIGRLGGPGLIPVSFIEIKDMATGQSVKDPHEAVRKAGVPKVEEWKKLAADYKNSSISLGKFDVAGQNGQAGLQEGMSRMSMQNGQQGQRASQTPQQPQPHPPPPQQQQQQQQQQPRKQALLAPISASVPRYCFEADKYWYIIECVLEDGSHWELSRYYQNFYDFQIRLLQTFPNEAGNSETGTQRILPYMPGPVTYVTDHISNMRRESLDDYVKRLLNLPAYISRSEIVRELFAPREGDFELDPSAMQDDFRLSHGSRRSAGYDHQLDGGPDPDGRLAPGRNLASGSSAPQHGSQGNMQRQPSSLTQDSSRNSNGQAVVLTPASSNTALTSAQQPPGSSNGQGQPPNSGLMTIKCWWGEDLVKLRVAGNISFSALQEKLQERFKARDEIRVQWQDGETGNYIEIVSDSDLHVFFARSAGKLILFADYA